MMVHWHEGLFLLPHHLQMLQKLALDRLGAAGPLIHRYMSGVIELDLTLSRESVAVRRLKAVMPSGVMIDYPGSAAIAPLDISAEMARSRSGFKLRLGLPDWSEHEANSFDFGEEANPQMKRRFCLDKADVADENKGGDKKAVIIRKFHARLLLESDNTSGLEVLPLARIEPTPGDQLPRLDENFAPPLLRLKAWPPLFDLVNKLVVDLERSRGSLLKRVQEGGLNLEGLHGNQLTLLLRLRSINHFLPRLRALAEVTQAFPFEVYCDLAGLLGELTALDPANDALMVEAFAHEAPWDQFQQLDKRIRKHLEPDDKGTVREIKLEQKSATNWVGGDDRMWLESAREVYLRVISNDFVEGVTSLVANPDKFKLNPFKLNNRPLRGIPLTQVTTPKILPAQQDFHYYRVERDATPAASRLWKQLVEEQKLSVYWSPTEPVKLDKISVILLMPT
jgi:type VI secretion system protein ImpJ